jgi:hypothetical protein
MKHKILVIALFISLVILAACNIYYPDPGSNPTPRLLYSHTDTGSPTPHDPDGCDRKCGVPLAEYQAEMARYQRDLAQISQPISAGTVLDDLISQTLLAQAAHENGFVLSGRTLQKDR